MRTTINNLHSCRVQTSTPFETESDLKYKIALAMNSFCYNFFLAHLSRRLRGNLYYRQAPSSVVRPSVVRRPFTISNGFSSKTTRSIATKFHIQPPGPLGKKSYSNGLGHMTNMAAMPIYGKNFKKSSSPEPIDQWP